MSIKTILLSIATLCLSVTACATPQSSTMKVQEVDYSGKPPFKRRMVSVDVADTAQLETTETTLVRTTEFAGKPPFKRNVEKLEIVDSAELQASPSTENQVRRGRPPFKRH